MGKSKIKPQEFRIYAIKTTKNFYMRVPKLEKQILWRNGLGKHIKLDISVFVTTTCIKMYCYSSEFRPLH